MPFIQQIDWKKLKRERRRAVIEERINKIIKPGKKIAKALLFGMGIIYGLQNPYLLFPGKRGIFHYLSLYSLQKEKVIPEDNPQRVRESLYYLTRKNFIDTKIQGNQILLKLTDEGKKHFRKCLIEEITLPRSEKWDGYWRFFLFDVPEKHRAIRDILRNHLQRLGFLRIQKSVWVYPYDCEKEMGLICECLLASRYALMFTAKIKNDTFLKKYFIRRKFKI